MAYILKSNKAVNDPNNIFPVYTEYGEATANLVAYMNERDALSDALTQTNFNALKNFENGLRNLGVWDNLIEFMPLLGNSANSQFLKYKFKTNKSMAANGSFGASNIEAGKGLVYAKPNGAMPSVNAKITGNDLFTNGVTAFIYYGATNDTQGNSYRHLFGLGGTDADDANTMDFKILESSGGLYSKWLNSATSATDKSYNKANFLIAYQVRVAANMNVTNRQIWDNGVSVSQNSAGVILANGTAGSKDLYLGAKNGASSAFPFYGKIRLFVLFDGNVDAAKVPQINALINNFIVATGKTLQ